MESEHPEREANRRSNDFDEETVAPGGDEGREDDDGPADDEDDEVQPKPIEQDETVEETHEVTRQSDPDRDPRWR